MGRDRVAAPQPRMYQHPQQHALDAALFWSLAAFGKLEGAFEGTPRVYTGRGPRSRGARRLTPGLSRPRISRARGGGFARFEARTLTPRAPAGPSGDRERRTFIARGGVCE